MKCKLDRMFSSSLAALRLPSVDQFSNVFISVPKAMFKKRKTLLK